MQWLSLSHQASCFTLQVSQLSLYVLRADGDSMVEFLAHLSQIIDPHFRRGHRSGPHHTPDVKAGFILSKLEHLSLSMEFRHASKEVSNHRRLQVPLLSDCGWLVRSDARIASGRDELSLGGGRKRLKTH